MDLASTAREALTHVDRRDADVPYFWREWVGSTGTVRVQHVFDASWEAALGAMIGKLLDAPAAAAR